MHAKATTHRVGRGLLPRHGARGWREAIFEDAADRSEFLAILGLCCQRHGWLVHAWVLMGNHYHLLLETPQPNLSSGMRVLQQAYTQRFNRRHGVSGHLFGGRYKAVLIQGDLAPPAHRGRQAKGRRQDHSDYFKIVADYIHLNALRAGLVRLDRGKGLLAYPWSSLVQAYARPASRRVLWMEVARVLAAYEVDDSARGRGQMLSALERNARAETAERAGVSLPEGQSLQASLRRGWYFGTVEYGQRVLEALRRAGAVLTRRGEHYEAARAVRANGEQEASRLLDRGFRQLRVNAEDLVARGRRRGDWRPIVMAAVVRERTSVSQAWLASRCGLRNAANVSQQLQRLRAEAARQRPLARMLEQLRKLA